MNTQTPGSNGVKHVVLPKIPTTWPGAFGLYKYSKKAVLTNLETLLFLVIISLLASFVLQTVDGRVGTGIAEFISLLISAATIVTFLASIRGGRLQLVDALRACGPMLLLKYLINAIAVGVLLIASFVLFVIPFFFVLPRLFLASYFLIDKNLGPLEAIQASWDATKGHSGKIWGTIGAAIAMGLLMFTIIGIPFALYFLFMYSASGVVLYEFITKTPQTPETTPQGGPIAPIK